MLKIEVKEVDGRETDVATACRSAMELANRVGVAVELTHPHINLPIVVRPGVRYSVADSNELETPGQEELDAQFDGVDFERLARLQEAKKALQEARGEFQLFTERMDIENAILAIDEQIGDLL